MPKKSLRSQGVVAHGYQIVRTYSIEEEGQLGEERWFVTSLTPIGEEVKAVKYDPLARDLLFAQFAHLECSEQAVVGFATRYGLLFAYADADNDKSYYIPIPIPGEQHRYHIGIGEPVEAWYREIRDMREAVDLWEMAQDTDTARLREHIRIDDNTGALTYVRPDGKEPCSLSNERFHYKAKRYDDVARRGGNVRRAALYWIQEQVSDKMRGEISPRLVWTPDSRRLDLAQYPYSLLGAMWYQFALALTQPAARRVGICEVCGQPMEFKRKGRQYCSTACSQKAYRRRCAERSEEVFENGT